MEPTHDAYCQHLEGILNTMQSALISLTLPERKLILASSAFEDVFGYPPERFIDDSEFYKQVVHPDDMTLTTKAMHTCIEKGLVELDHRIIWPDGQVRWLHRRAWVNYDEKGQPIRINDTAQDITPQRQAEQQLQLFQAAIEQSNEAIIITDNKGRMLSINPAFTTITGYIADNVFGQTPEILLDIDQFSEPLQTLHNNMESGQVFEGEMKAYHKNGREIDVAWSTAPIFNSTGKITNFVMVLRDRTTHNRARRRLRESEELHRLTLSSISDAVFITDEAGQFTFICPNVSHIFGYSNEEIAALGNISLILDVSFAEPNLLNSVGEIKNVGQTIVDKHSNQHHLLINAKRVDIKSGTILYSCRDITEQKRAQDILRASEQRYRQMFEHIWLPKMIINPENGNIIDANPAAVEFYGYPAEILKSMSIMQLDVASPTTVLDKLAQAMRGEIKTTTSVHRLADGTTRDMEGYSSRLTLDEQSAFYGIFLDVTERNAAQQALETARNELEQRVWARTAELEHARDRIEAIFNHSGDGIVLLNIDHGIEQANFAFEHMFGVQIDAWVGQSITDFILPEAKPRIQTAMQTVVDTHTSMHIETQVVRIDGTTFEAEISLSPVNHSDKPVENLIFIIHDITARKKQEQQLRYLASLQAHMLDAVIATNLNFEIQSWNRAAEHLFGWKAEEVIGQRLGEVLHTELSAEQNTIAATNTLFEEGYWSGEAVQQHRNGEKIHVLASIVLNKDEHGNPIGVIGVNHDITKRRQAINALQASELKFRSFIEAAPVAMLISDPEGQIVFVNSATEDLFGYDRVELIGESVDILVPEEHREAHHGHIEEYNSRASEDKQRHAPLDVVGRHRSGQVIPVNIQLSNVELQPVPLTMVFIIDISQRKQAEEALKSALEKEKELGDLKSRFVSMASHQFRTPLASILATTETLTYYRSKMDDQQLDARLNRIRSQIARMQSIMEDVLDLARIQTAQIQPELSAGDLDAFCSTVIEEFETQPEYHGRIQYTCANPPPIHADFDPSLMHHILTNLLHNALKYSDANTHVELHLTQTTNSINLRVVDSGLGIPTEELKHVFEPFHRAANVNKITGTGLGLSIVKQAVDAHHGKISIESKLGQGTTVDVHLPKQAVEH